MELLVKLAIGDEDLTPNDCAAVFEEGLAGLRVRVPMTSQFVTIETVQAIAGGEKVLAVETADLKTVIQAASDRAGNIIRYAQTGRGRASERAMGMMEGQRILDAIEKLEGKS